VAQAGVGGGEVERGVLLVAGGANERQHLFLAEDVDAGAANESRPVDLGDRTLRPVP